MSKLLFASVAAITLAAFAAAPTLASHTGCSDPATLDVGGVYLDVRHVNDDASLYSVWIFAESGVVPGLQRGGSQVAFSFAGMQDVAMALGETDLDCPATPASDHLIL